MVTKKQLVHLANKTTFLHMKKFLLETIPRISIKDAIILVATRVIPVEFAVDIIAGTIFGIQHVLIAHFTTVSLRYMATIAYGAYAVRKAERKL